MKQFYTLLLAFLCLNFSLNLQAQYCPGLEKSELLYYYESTVTIGEMTTVNGNNLYRRDSIFEVDVAIGYHDRTDLKFTIKEGRANQFIYNMNEFYRQSLGHDEIAFFIDWNKDGDWLDENEKMGESDGKDLPFIQEIDIPDEVSPGRFSLRVIHREGDETYGEIEPCPSENDTTQIILDYGLIVEEEDYFINGGGVLERASENGFESGNWDLWKTFVGHHPNKTTEGVISIECCAIETEEELVIDFPILSSDDTPKFSIITAGVISSEPIQKVPAWGGNYSLRIGRERGLGEAEKIRREFRVDPEFPVLKIGFAHVTDDPGHGYDRNPYFTIEILDVEGRRIPGAEFRNTDFEYEAFNLGASDSYYFDWQTFSIDLTKYIDKDVTINVINADCAYGAHNSRLFFDYAFESKKYIKSSKYKSCSGKAINLTAPSGMKSYLWSTGETTQEIDVIQEIETTYSVNCITEENETIEFSKRIGMEKKDYCRSNSQELETLEIVTIYPNPATNEITISGNLSIGDQLKIIDAQGRIVLVKTIHSMEKERIDINNLLGGMYLLIVTNERKTMTSKLIVK